MKRDDCEKLLTAYRESVIAGNGQAAQPLFEVIVGIMADEKKPSYRDGIVVRDAPIQRPGVTTVPTHVMKPIITCNGAAEITTDDSQRYGAQADSKRITAHTATWDNSEKPANR